MVWKLITRSVSAHCRTWACQILDFAGFFILHYVYFQKQTAMFFNFALEAALMSAFPYLHHQIVHYLEELICDVSWEICGA